MNNLKVGDTFEFALYQHASGCLHDYATQCIVLKTHILPFEREKYFTCIQCPGCEAMIGNSMWSRTSDVYHQILFGNKKIIITHNNVGSLWPDGCPECKQSE